jgi:sialate O-acetylesterase
VQEWRKVEFPGDYRNASGWGDVSGALWFRRSVDVSQPVPAGAKARLLLGAVRGIDYALVNGKPVGHTDRVTNPNDLSTANRVYELPDGALTQGKNVLELFVVFDTRGSLSPGDGSLMPPLTLEFFRERSENTVPAPLAMEGWWRGIAVDGKVDLPADGDKGWHRIKVPGTYMAQHAHWGAHMGYFWYKRSFALTDLPAAGTEPTLVLGAVDDEDDTYVNGVLVGHIGKDTNPKDYWCAMRSYRLPAGLLKVGENTVTVRINNTFLDGGIMGPAALLFEDPKVTAERRLTMVPYLHDVDRTDDPYMYCGW